MAITYKGGNRLVGLSSDTKPTTDGSLVNGSSFTETDTGKKYKLNYGEWIETNKASNSVSELFRDHSSTTQHMWDLFSGSSPDSDRWAITNWNGVTGATAMDDSVDGGLKLTTSGNRSALQFNDIRPFTHAGSGSEVIWVAKKVGATADGTVGLAKNSNGFLNGGVSVNFDTSVNIDFSALNDAGSGTTASTGQAVATALDWHVYKMTCATSNQTCSVDGVLTNSTTATMDSLMQPVALLYTASSTVLHLRYCEAYNI
mgnify:FL=1